MENSILRVWFIPVCSYGVGSRSCAGSWSWSRSWTRRSCRSRSLCTLYVNIFSPYPTFLPLVCFHVVIAVGWIWFDQRDGLGRKQLAYCRLICGWIWTQIHIVLYHCLGLCQA